MVSQFSLQQLASGISPQRMANDRRFLESQRANEGAQNELLKILRQEQIRGAQLGNTRQAQQISQASRPQQNQFKRITGQDGNQYEVEISPNGQIVGQPKAVQGLGQKPNSNPIDKVPEAARKFLPPELIADPNSVDRPSFNKAVVAAIGQARSQPKVDGKLFDRASKLRSEITNATKDFQKIEGAYSRVQASAADPSAAGDMALIFNFMKVLDPGSTVREGEFATAQNAGGVDSRVRSVFNQVINGERLSEQQRADFLGRAGKLFEGQKQLAGKRTNNIVKIGERFGISRADLTTADVGELSDEDLDAALAELQ